MIDRAGTIKELSTKFWKLLKKAKRLKKTQRIKYNETMKEAEKVNQEITRLTT